jgi:Cu-Zn family superoxide dismutase
MTLSLGACPGQPDKQDLAQAADLAPAARLARAQILDRSMSRIGTAMFTEIGADQVRVIVEVEKASPGKHGLHVHAEGKCEVSTTDMGVAGDFLSAGGHFNPANKMHGAPGAAEHHAGDFGNLEAMLVGADGRGRVELTTGSINLREGAAESVLGKAIIFHAGEDDLKTQPTGNSGARQGCGVIALSP